MSQHNTLVDLFQYNVSSRFDAAAAMTKVDGRYVSVTWGDLKKKVDRFATALAGLDLAAHEKVCILAQTRIEWVISDLAILSAGATTVPIYPTLLAEECQYIIENSGAVMVIAENSEQVQKLRAVRERIPEVKRVIQLDGEVGENSDAWVVSYAGLLEGDPDEALLNERRKAISKESILTIIYTSGTTGKPKGVVLSHDSMLYEAEAIQAVDVVRSSDVQLIFLPLAHVFAKVLEISWLATGHVLAFAESFEKLKQNMVEVQPTLMAGVPRVFEKIHTAILQKAMSAGGAKAVMFKETLRLSEKLGESEWGGPRFTFSERLKWRVLKKLVLKKVHDNVSASLGGKMRLMVSGGAPLAKKIGWFFRDADILILEGYGMTESAAASAVTRPDQYKIGTVGLPVPGTEIKIASDGEILIRGRGVMLEYYKNPEATAETIIDGWLYTGDVGEFDAAGMLRITDRKKDLIITAGGKNVAPQNIENLVKTHPLISQVVVHGDRRKFLSAIVTLDADVLSSFCSERNLGHGSHAELSQKSEVDSEVGKAIDEFNKQLARYETIKRFKILEHDFSLESGELTPSLKVKRKVVNERYKEVFDGFYDENY